MNLLLKEIEREVNLNYRLKGLVLTKIISISNFHNSSNVEFLTVGEVLCVPINLVKKVDLDGDELLLITQDRLVEFQLGLMTKWAN